MSNDDDSWNDETEIDPEVWLPALLAIMGDKDRREVMVQKISKNTGQTSEQVELIISATINYLSNKSRSG